MDDLISRAEAVRALASSNGDYLDAWERLERLPAVDAAPVVMAGAELTDAELIEAIRKAPITLKPAVDAAPVVHGRWVKVSGYVTPGGDPVWKCSECGKGVHVYGIEHGTYGADIADGQWISCPNCGAKMDGERRDDE